MADIIPAQNPSARKPLTQERLRQLLHYDPATGVFRWAQITSHRVSVGDVAGSIKDPTGDRPYRTIMIDGKNYRVNRLAWLYVHGGSPRFIDHKNGDTLDDRIDNLRPCTRSQNNANAKRGARNRSGFKGVCWVTEKSKWIAQIQRSGQRYHLVYFDNPRAAHDEYMRAARGLFGEFARAG